MKKTSFHTSPSKNLASEIGSSPVGECPYVLFLGAGASVMSGIPTVNSLVAMWKEQIFCSINNYDLPMDKLLRTEYEKWEKADDGYSEWFKNISSEIGSETPYSTLFQYIRKTKESRQSFIESIVDKKYPSLGYVYLAQLLKNDYINCVLTTNFDDLISDAMFMYFFEKPLVCQFESTIQNFNSSSIRPKIVKLHGDFLYNDMKNTDSELSNLGPNMEDKMIELCQDKGLIVVGYSGNDDSIMNPLFEQMRTNDRFLSKGLHWCLHKSSYGDKNSIDRELLPPNLAKILDRFPDKAYLYQIDSFDHFMNSICVTAGLSLASAFEESKKRNAATSFLKAGESLSEYMPLGPHMGKDMGIALKTAIVENISIEDKILQANQLWREGVNQRDNYRNYDNAIALFEKGLFSCEEVLSNKNLSLLNKLTTMRRQAGCYVGIAKIRGEQNEDFEKYFANADKVVADAKSLVGDVATDEYQEIYCSILYNAICSTAAQGTISKNEPRIVIEKILIILKELKKYGAGVKKINKLKENEPDLKPYVDLIDWSSA